MLRVEPAGQRVFPGPWNESIRRFADASVADGREYRLMTPALPRGHASTAEASPDGRVAVAVTAEWVSLYDVQTGREVGSVRFPSKISVAHAFFGPAGHLFINCSPIGCFRWPVRRDPRKPGDVVIGPPDRLRIHPSHAVGTSRDGTVIAEAMYNGYATARYAGGWILHADRPDPPRNVAPGVGMNGVSVSPDGRWVAFSGDRSFVFDSRTAQPVWEPRQNLGACRFSPDGKWLATGIDGGRVYAVGTWEPGPQLGHGAIRGFSEDGYDSPPEHERGLSAAGRGRYRP